ncbi:TPA: ankyrin repeat domain-containing protein [Legionella pneumophila subsp. pneumophila]|uniref:ankyrin repeat domain-containing protein n=1 Tax=Legionella sp. PATHC039 TaxID=2992042 RepID=UPI001A31ACE1|nr:ankyrin repeat domain-containing protein [Legionella sp. PATHC039]MCW8394329.1 ankyrin repeat domain-containing protein [Legionella sp. PATHC039]HAT8859802.1 ankyrin repeat domain-containing protein [Legionella pneumophila subsp. pneumophila]HAT9651658.1 ankyrin repeat domain-containing protein [Legionella pneumophila subsp. pneumophila]HAT9921405.1 ankyrin repeat domain-containing protein [Legionella pneumophila subsp. pneumophila]
MSQSVDQGQVIDRLNSYLKWHNMPVSMNEEGICNGLVTVYAKYVLEGKEKRFFELLDQIVRMEPDSAIESEVNQFIYDVVLTLFPHQFNKKLSQANSMCALTINNKPLASSFDFAIATHDKNWEEIFKNLALQEDEIVRVSGTAHAIAVRRKNNKYIVYDPNYSSGTKEFSNEHELISELHYNVFGYHNGFYVKGGLVGMMISVIRHPDNKKPRAFPQVTQFYDRYLTENNINGVAVSFHGGTFNTLEHAAMVSHAEVIKNLLEKGAKDNDDQAAGNAVMCNNVDALKVLLGKNRDTELFQRLFHAALENGREEAYDALFSMKGALPFNSSIHAIRAAAKGGNPVLLAKVMNYFKRNHTGFSDLENAVSSAIASGSVQCVKLLVNQLNENKRPLNDKKKMEYLLESIKQNQSYMVAYFIKDIPPEYLKTIYMSVSTVEKANLHILCQLKHYGVAFTSISKAVFEQKEHRSIGFISILGIFLCKFTDFLKEILLNDCGIYCSRSEENGEKKSLFTIPKGPVEVEQSQYPKLH